jgi:hypothetical protein
MNTWAHVKSDMARSLLEGRVFADKINLSIVIDTMLNDQAEDAVNMDIPERVFWSRADALDRAHAAYMVGDFGLCMNRIKTFYLV